MVTSSGAMTNALADKILGALSKNANSEGESAFVPGTEALFPRNSTQLYDMVTQGHAPSLVRYNACSRCGRLQRKEHRDKSDCPECKLPWDIVQNYFSIIEHFKRAFGIRQLAEALSYEGMRETPVEGQQHNTNMLAVENEYREFFATL